MTTLNEINKFLGPKKMAMAGVSRNPKKFGGAIFKELKEKGFDLYPVNPNADEIQGVKCFKSVEELPDHVTHLFVVTPKQETLSVVNAAASKGIKMIWIQQKSDTPEAVKAAADAGIPLIYKKCIMMFADPVQSFHKFHRFWVKAFGGYPKMVRSAN
ncbi:CoA-binding protein [Maribellus maritimus]|uniref:CoA-binding protein n=1 Tax=Maribellus maritimus TaxID=2870838 RepID=UPI001EE9F92A|nr:CoA-binding protein [Maribellus maritimus]MCG6188857.1 CoA-binding protein [Maribellus maritimus]